MACCEVMAIQALEKPPWSKCENQCAAGCGIYEERPDECRTFDCGWLKGFLSEDDRPDKLGMMFVKWNDRRIWMLEVWPGAFQAESIQKLAEDYPHCDWDLVFHKDSLRSQRHSLFVRRRNLDRLEELVQEYLTR